MRQGLRLEPVLQAISDFLDVQQNVIERVRSDLVRGLKNAATGRSGLTPQQVLRSLVLMRVKNWDYRELREWIADGYTLRQFTDFHSRRVPRHDGYHRGADRHSSSDRQHAVVGCRSRRHALGRPPRRSAGTPAYQGVPGSNTIGTASDAGDPTDDHEAASGAADRDIS